MLAPIQRKVRRRRFAVYDMEWRPSDLGLRMIGVYDREEGYRWYRTVEEFLIHELTPAHSGVWYYGHNAGKSDMEYILHEILTRSPHYSVSASFSGSSAIIVRITNVLTKRNWLFLDSLWLVRDSLRNIGHAVGMAKGNADEDISFYESAPEGELRDYNEQDCRILYTAIEAFQDEITQLGGQLNSTLASCAMDLFRRRYLSEPIATSKAVNQAALKAYFASRVEVLRPNMKSGHYYDINSSFPYSMTFPAPGNVILTTRVIPDNHDLFLALCDVEIPDCYLPTLPLRQGLRVFFPVGRWQNWITGPDFRLLEETGAQIHAVHKVYLFRPNEDMREYATEIYAKRVASRTPFEKMLYKLLLNSLYGKFAENPIKSGMLWNPHRPPIRRGPEHEDSPYLDARMVVPGVYAVEKEVNVAHRHVPFAAHIVALSRRWLWQWLSRASESGEVYYCDTDGIATTAPDLPTGKGLGELKHEASVIKGVFVAPKLYRMLGTFEGEEKDKIKAKGFGGLKDEKGNKRGLTAVDFENLLQGESLEIERMLSIREALRKGDSTPRKETMNKQLAGTLRPKRAPNGTNNTRPWTIEELREEE